MPSRIDDIGDLLLNAIGYMLFSALALPDNLVVVLWTNSIEFYRSGREETDVNELCFLVDKIDNSQFESLSAGVSHLLPIRLPVRSGIPFF